MTTLSIQQIAGMIDAKIIGDPEKLISGVSSFEDADSGQLSFASDPKFLGRIDQTRAGAVIIPQTQTPVPNLPEETTCLICDSPKIAFFKIAAHFHPEKQIAPGIHSTAVIDTDVHIGRNPVISSNVFIGERVRIGDHVHLMPNVYIGDDAVIGDNVVLKPNVTIMEKTRIGSHVMIHSGSVIGCDGYGFAQEAEKHEKLAHSGYVQIKDHVEIGANTTIDRGTLGTTVIGNGVKIDNQVHIAHNVKIGDHTLIVAQVGIAGSARIENNVIIAGKAGISGHLTIEAGSIVGPMAGVHSSVGKNQIVSGIPQMPHTRWRKVVSIISRLPEMRKKLFSFEKRLNEIEKKIQ
jgi:UDP-3-O-[3-hydroxymyristoyl] glucosamine N-acyltransferase